MHKEQMDWCEHVKRRFPSYFINKKVLEMGSLDVNGNNRYLFENCEYIGLDVLPGKNVDVVSVAHEYQAENETFDVVLSTNALEHDMHYSLTLKKMANLLKPNGLMLISAAHSHSEHGTVTQHPWASATAQLGGEWSTFYKSFIEDDIRDTLDLEKEFKQHELKIDKADLLFWGIKNSNMKQETNYGLNSIGKKNERQ